MSDEFEVVDFAPVRTRQGIYQTLHPELMSFMLKVPEGKSVRKGFSAPEKAKGYYTSLRTFIKKQKLHESYFVSLVEKVADDGKFYVYIGRRKE